jgi:hypothetical protein
MSTTIISRQPKAPILYARIGVVIRGQRYLHVCRRDADGREFDEWSRLPWNDHDMNVVPNLGGDLDDAYLKDIVESVEGRRAKRRVERPDITTLYHDMNEQRANELAGRRLFPVKKG